MKRIFLFLICGIILCGCTKIPEGQLNQTTTFSKWGPDTRFSNYYEYWWHFAHDAEPPVNFIHYDQIQSLGKFQEYASYHGIDSDGTAQYTYTLKDDAGRLFEISVFKTKYTYKKTQEQPIFFDKSDLSSVVGGFEGHRAVICDNYDNLVYTYDSTGKLMDIYFEIEGFNYGISLTWDNNRFRGNPEGAFVERLLCLESAPAAVEEFEQMISIPYEPDTNTSH